MAELPLFPLNTVLFPGAPLRLHIFEERYKEMIGMCIEDERPFGVTLIRQGVEALGPLAEPYMIGCSAVIAHVQRLDQGRMNIVAIGQERFRIRSLDRKSKPYLLSQVEAYPYSDPGPQVLAHEGARLRAVVVRYISILLEAGGTVFDFKQLPTDPLLLGYTAASLLQIAPTEKQALFELPNAELLLVDLLAIYRRETALLREVLSPGHYPSQGDFSLN